MKTTKVNIATASAEDFFDRLHRDAERLDRGETIPAEINIIFEDPIELLNVLTVERVRLLRKAKAGVLPISDLASGLNRDIRAVSRDVSRLENAGLVRTSYKVNPGHGRCKIVEPLAKVYRLVANI